MMHNKKAKVGASKMGKVATAKPKMGSASKRADGIAKKGLTRWLVAVWHDGWYGKAKMMAGGGKAKMMASGGMPMVMKDGNKVPAFAADGKGKMAAGGRAKMMAGGGMSKMMKSGGRV
jgi:hypothetical protein